VGNAFGSAEVGRVIGRTHVGGGVGREFHRSHRYGYGYAYGGGTCWPYDELYPQQWPYTCY
jgi:hypothetical protein